MKNYATFKIKTMYGEETCRFIRSRYCESYISGGGIYLGLESYDEEYRFWERYCDVSTNITTENCTARPSENSIFIRNDSDWYPGVAKVFKETGLAKSTGNKGYSGFCEYDEWLVDSDKLQILARSLEVR